MLVRTARFFACNVTTDRKLAKSHWRISDQIHQGEDAHATPYRMPYPADCLNRCRRDSRHARHRPVALAEPAGEADRALRAGRRDGHTGPTMGGQAEPGVRT